MGRNIFKIDGSCLAGIAETDVLFFLDKVFFKGVPETALGASSHKLWVRKPA
jgi:hypothetical protein